MFAIEETRAELEPTVKAVRRQLEAMLPTFRDALPVFVQPERFIRTPQIVVAQNPKLLECDRTSLFAACIQCAELGLLPDGVLGEAALVPLPDRTVGLRTMYKGLLKLARSQPELSTVYADIVYSNDTFSADPLCHEDAEGDRGHPVRYYARAKWKETGEWETVVVGRAEIEPKRPATHSYFDALALRDVLVSLCSILPQLPALRRALEIERSGGRLA